MILAHAANPDGSNFRKGQGQTGLARASNAAVRAPRRRALAPAARRLFLKLILCRLKKRHTALRLPAIRRLRIAATISSSVESGCPSNQQQTKRPPALPAADTTPARLRSNASRRPPALHPTIAELALTSNHSAASRRDAPDSTASTTLSRNSKEHGLGIDALQGIRINATTFLIQIFQGIPIQPSRNPL